MMRPSILFLLLFPFLGQGQEQVARPGKQPHHLPFQGELLQYRVRYGFITAGQAQLAVSPGPDYGERSTWQVVGTGRSTGAFDWVFKVRDHYETHLDRAGLFPHRFIRSVKEGGYRLERDIAFNAVQNTAAVQHHGRVDHLSVPDGCQDLVSAFYYARSLPLENMATGDLIEVPTLVDGKVHSVRARLTGREQVRVPSGTYDCWRFSPVVQEGRIWKSNDDLTVYVSADARRIPVLVESDLVVGSVRIELLQDHSPHAAGGTAAHQP